MTTKFEVSKLQ